MNLLDNAPGGFVVLTTFIVYGVVLAETWMLTTASLVAMGAVLTLIIVVSGLIVRSMSHVMGSEEYSLGHVTVPPVAVSETVEAPSAERHRSMATARPALHG